MKKLLTDEQMEDIITLTRAKRAAKKAVYRALASGKIQQQPCSDCGSTQRLHQQHEDYSKPLEVKWICSDCMKKRNKEYEMEVRRILKNDKDNWSRYNYGATNSWTGDD